MSNIYAFTDTRWSAAGTTFNGIFLTVSNGGGSAAVGAAASRLLKFSNNGTDVFGVTLAGYLGLVDGAATPTYVIDILKSTTSGVDGTYPAIRVGNTGTSANSIAKIQLEANNAASKSIWYSTLSGAVLITGAPAVNSSYIGTQTDTGFGLFQNGTLRAYFQPSTGYLGIGTNNPVVPVNIVNSAGSQLYIQHSVGGAGFVINQASSGGTVILQQAATADMSLTVNNGSEVIRLRSSDLFLQVAAGIALQVTPTVNTSAATTITNGADSASNLGHRISFSLNGTTYWIPCGATAF